MDIDIGISPKDRKKIADGLSRVMADTYTLYLKTHNYHWNVTGPMFQTLHLMFEVQYNELWLAVDLLAERIRSLGFQAPGTYQQFAKLTSIEDEEGVLVATQMIRDLLTILRADSDIDIHELLLRLGLILPGSIMNWPRQVNVSRSAHREISQICPKCPCWI